MTDKLKKTLIHFVESPITLMCVWVLFLSTPAFNFLRLNLISHQLSFGQNLRTLLNISATIFQLVSNGCCVLLIGTWVYRYSSSVIPKAQRVALAIIAITGIAFIACNSFLIAFEEKRFPNYLYSKIGSSSELLSSLNQISLVTLFLILMIFLQSGRILGKVSKNISHSPFQKLRNSAQILLIVVFLFVAVRSFYPIFNFRKSSVESKMTYEEKFGPEFKFIEALQEFVPEDATIIHPPQNSRWPFIGNQPTIRYFLYPRRLVSGVLVNNSRLAHQLSTVYFANMYPLDSEQHWPLVGTQSATIRFDEKTDIPFSSLQKVGESHGVTVYRISFL